LFKRHITEISECFEKSAEIVNKRTAMNNFWMRRDGESIRYRVWSLSDGRFVKDVSLSINPDGFLSAPFNGDDNCIVQEYIGRKDCEGNWICEGDILETDEAGWIGVVVYGGGSFMLEDSTGGFSGMPNWRGCRIIGNMLENPEKAND
jgi:hypothetical protein